MTRRRWWTPAAASGASTPCVVADASIFPTIPAANIHVSVVAAAEKVAAGLAA